MRIEVDKLGELKGPDYYDNMSRMLMYKFEPEHSHYFKMWKWAMRHINKTDKIIELGCGTGQFAKMLADRDVEDYNGYDFSTTNISFAKNEMCEEYKGRFHVANIFEVEIPPDAKVIALEVLEHIEDDVGLLKRLSKNEIIISVPNFDAPSHVRKFDKIEDIISRYGENHYFHSIEIFKFKKGNWICILVGEPNETDNSGLATDYR